MRKFLFLAVCLAGPAAIQAAEVKLTQRCWLSTKTGPYSSFEINYKLSGSSSVNSKATVKFIFTKASGSVGERGTVKAVDVKPVDHRGVSLSFDYNDWASTSIDLSEDDNGVAAFVDFRSDGPELRSFYRCSSFPEGLLP